MSFMCRIPSVTHVIVLKSGCREVRLLYVRQIPLAIQRICLKSVCRVAKNKVSVLDSSVIHGIVSKGVCRGGMERSMSLFCVAIHGMRGKSVCRRRRGYARNSWPKKSKGQTVTSVWIHFYSVRGIAKFFLWAESI